MTEMVETILEDALFDAGGDAFCKIKLTHTPTSVKWVKGNLVRDERWPRKGGSLEERQRSRWLYDTDTGSYGRYEVNGKEITIFDRGNDYIGHTDEYYPFHPKKEFMIFTVSYFYMENYDPNLAKV